MSSVSDVWLKLFTDCGTVCFYMSVCVLVLRQNRAAEMRQALQIFVGWLTAVSRCQTPAAEKRLEDA